MSLFKYQALKTKPCSLLFSQLSIKILVILLGAFIFTFTNIAFAEVKVKKAPLTWKQAGLADGSDLYVALCAACHGKGAKGDGPVADVLKKKVSNLTLLASRNDGTFPRERVTKAIEGKSRMVSHGTIDMPVWGDAFKNVRPDWKMVRREAMARQRIHNLVEYISTIQAK